MTIPFDPTKPCQTRAGQTARVLPERLKSTVPRLIVVITADNGNECVTTRHLNGQNFSSSQSPADLINVPEENWINIYDNGPGDIAHKDRETADRAASGYLRRRIACISFCEGDGLKREINLQ